MHGYTCHCGYCHVEFDTVANDSDLEQIDYNPATRTLLEYEWTDLDGWIIRRVPADSNQPGPCTSYGEDSRAAVDSYLRWLWDRRQAHPAGGGQ